MAKTWSVELYLIAFVDDIALANCCRHSCLVKCNNFCDELVLRNLTACTEKLLVFCWRIVVETSCQFALGYFPHFVNQILLDGFKFFWALQVSINSSLVAICHCGYIVDRFHTALDFQAINAVFNHIRNMVNHTHINGRHRKFFWNLSFD
ncbi:Uncharacterised protein [Chlamydia trachomatis]|nr:Uncharacterised protein [Chlamydia trachomatis]